jgi:pyrrolidone-carboxylate peptidase
VCKPADLARAPEDLDSVDAAVLPLVLLTGAQVIELGIRPRSGETILVTGAIGGVGRTAVLDESVGQNVDHMATVDSAPHMDRDCLTAISVSTKLIWLFVDIWLCSDQPERTERM